MAKKNKGGRPTVMTPKTIEKLEEGFSYGFTDAEACLHAGIHKDTLYKYCKDHPEFSDRKEALKKQPNMLAKRNVSDKLTDGDVNTSKWQLERKDPDYVPSQKNEINLTLTDQLRKAYKQIESTDSTE